MPTASARLIMNFPEDLVMVHLVALASMRKTFCHFVGWQKRQPKPTVLLDSLRFFQQITLPLFIYSEPPGAMMANGWLGVIDLRES